MIIKNIEKFNPLYEGTLKSFFSSIGNLFSKKESKMLPIIKNIKGAKEEILNDKINSEKEIFELSRINSPESRFQSNNLERQAKAFSSLKNHEIDSLIKQANTLTKDDPRLQAFFSSELAKIEANTTERLIKNIKQYKNTSSLEDLNRQFDELVKDANKKTQFYDSYKEKGGTYLPHEDLIKDLDNEAIDFVDMTNQESISRLKVYSDEEIKQVNKDLRGLIFNLDMEYRKSIDDIRKEVRRAKKEEQDWILPNLENQERELKYYLKKPIDKIRYKLSLIEKEIRDRKYESYKTK